mgnify:CR=1 FL=1
MGKRIFFDQPSDPARAQALQKLILKRIDEKLKALPNLLQTQTKKAQEIFGRNKVTKKELETFLKKNDYDTYRLLKDLANEKKTFQRSFSEFLTTDADFFQRKGVFEVLLARNEDELFKTLKSFDRYISGTGSDDLAKHHGHLTSLRKLYGNVSDDWKGKYAQLAADSDYRFGDEGITKFDVIAHKPFDTIQSGPNKGKYNPKGILAEMGLKPLSKEGNTVYHRVLNRLNRLGAHGAYALGTRGVSIPEELGHLSPEEAFKVSRNLLDVEKVQIEQGKLIDGLLRRWQSKGNYKNTEEAFLDLERTLNATNKEGKLRYPEPNVKPLLAEFETQLEASKPKIELNKAALNVGKISDFDLRGDASRYEAPRVARSSWSAKRQAYAAMGQSPNPVMNVYGDTLGNVEDVLSFMVKPDLHTGAHLMLGTGQTLTNVTAGLGIYFKSPNLVARSTAANAYLGRAQQLLGMQSEGIELSRQGKLGTDFGKFGTDFKTDVDIKL